MLSAGDPARGKAGYVALERFDGTIDLVTRSGRREAAVRSDRRPGVENRPFLNTHPWHC
jgi:hypothetical protein